MDDETLYLKLKTILVFSNLTQDELKSIAEICEVQSFKDGEIIVTQDTISPHLYAILEGNVGIHAKNTEGGDIRISGVHQGDIFGEAAIFIDMKRTASVIADGNVKIVSISREELITYANKYLRAGMKIYLYIILSLLTKLKNTSAQLVLEKESTVSARDLENLKIFFPKTIDDILNGE